MRRAGQGVCFALALVLLAAPPRLEAQFGSTGFAWFSAGPSGIAARVNAVVADPRSTTTLLLASSGGVWRSIDSGLTWFPLTDSAPALQTCSLALDPANPDNLYAGTGDERSPRPDLGVLRSSDGGKSWSISTGFSPQPVCAVAVDPQDGKRVLAASLSGIFRSTDSGLTWKRVSTAPVQSLAYDSAANGIAYAGVYSPDFFLRTNAPSPLMRSTDGGATWNDLVLPPIDPFNPRNFKRASVAAGDPGSLYLAVSYSAGTLGAVDLYRSTDGGATWTVTPRASPAAGGRPALLYDASSKSLYLGTTFLSRSAPEAVSFTALTSAGNSINGIALLPDAVIAAGEQGLESVPLDGSASSSLPLPPLGQFISVNSDPVNASISYAGSDLGLWILPAGASQWKQAITVPIGRVQAAPPQTVYALGNTSFFRSTDGSAAFKSFTAIPASERRAPFPPLLVDPVTPDLLFVAGQGVSRSTDGGQTWSRISSNLDGANVVVALAFAPAQRQVMFAATTCLPELTPAGTSCPPVSRISRSVNNGASWQQVAVINGMVNRLVVDPRVSAVVYAVAGAFPGGPSSVAGLLRGDVLRSGDAGVTWETVRNNLPETPVNVLVIDPASPGSAFQPASTILVGTDLGVFVSFNAGSRWLAINAGLPNIPISDLTLRRPEGTLRAATFGRGTYRASFTNVFSAPVVVPLGADVSVVQGQSSVIPVTLSNSDVTGLDWTATWSESWLSASSTGGRLDPNTTLTLNFTINTAGLAVGNYRAQVKITRLGTATTTPFEQAFTLNLRVTTPPARLLAVSGDGVTGNAGASVSLVAQALDADGNPLSGLAVQFRITTGSGQLSAASVLTDSQGRATAVLTLPAAGGTVKVTAGVAGLATTFTVTVVRPPAPALNSGAAVNAASFIPSGPLAPGTIVAVFGTELAAASAAAATLPLPTALGGSSVTIAGVPVPLFFVSPGQINAVVPFGLAPGNATLQIEIQTAGGTVRSNAIETTIAAAAPGIFSLNAEGRGPGIFLKPDFSLVSASNPARRGGVVQFYATGLGAVDPPLDASQAAAGTEPLNRTVAIPVVSVSGQEAVLEYSGLAPGFAGLYQVNIRIPQNVTPGSNVPVNLRIGGALSNTVTLPVM